MPTSQVHITVKPPSAKIVDPQLTEQQQPTIQTQPTVQQTTPPTPAIFKPTPEPTGEVEEDDPEYALSKSNIKNLAN